ncbi:MAG: cation diffusion facilitator family transporter [bacterium]|nr:cation diffusion facilitator family transporter [bacterium]
MTVTDNLHVKTANRVSVVSIIVNVFLSAVKLAAGILAHSAALVSDAVHSLSDVLSTAAVIAGVNLSARKADEGHQYGHERIESIFSILLSVLLFATGVSIGIAGVQAVISGSYREAVMPGVAALAAALLSIAVKEWMYHYTIHAAKSIRSTALKADAWHHRSDALSSVGSFAGILLARLGFPIFDPIASVIICVFIIKAAYDIFKEATDELVDKSAGEEVGERLKAAIMAQDGVMSIDSLKTRIFGAKLYVDVEIGCNGEWTLYRAHSVAENVHDSIENSFPEVKHCMVHVNPKSVSVN